MSIADSHTVIFKISTGNGFQNSVYYGSVSKKTHKTVMKMPHYLAKYLRWNFYTRYNPHNKLSKTVSKE